MEIPEEKSRQRVNELIEFIAKDYHLSPENHVLEGFAAACYRDNTIGQLLVALQQKKANKDDCRAWEIKPGIWRHEIKQALELMLFDALEGSR